MANPIGMFTRLFRPSHRRSLDAAGGGRRWACAKPVGNLNAEAAAGGATIAARSNALYHNDSTVRAAVDALVAHIVGTGFVPLPKHPSAAVRARLSESWRRFIATADPAGRSDLDGLARLAALSMIRDGEAFALMRLVPNAGLAVPLQIELLHRDQLPMDRFSPIAADGGRIRAGIEFDGANRPVAYHFLPARPGDPYAPLDGAGWQTVRVGAADVLHVFRPQEIGQVRGLPWTVPVALLAHELGQFQDAALVKSKVAALFAGFVTDPDGQAGGLLGPGANGTVTASLEPGALIPLPAGSTVTFSDPPQTTDYPEFVRSHQRAIAAGMNTTYEQVSGDYAGVTFSSVRAALMEFRRKVEPIQFELAHQFYAPIWRRSVTLAVLSGAVDAPDFFDDPEAYMACEWLPPRWEYVNPAQDVAADIDAIAAGLKSRSQAIAERGYDPTAVDAERAADRAREGALGLSPTPVSPQAPRTPLADNGEPLLAPISGGPHA